MSKSNINVVHETEAQRRHARVRLPTRLVFKDQYGTSHALSLTDLSASGFSVRAKAKELQKGNYYSGKLLFKPNAIEFRIPIKFSVLYNLEAEQKVGCEFSDLGSDEISTLQLFISQFLAGDLTSSEEILTTISRDNFTEARKKSGIHALNGWRKTRAMLGTALAACVGMAAFAYIASNLYQHYFVTRAVTAVVNIDRETVQAPANGYFELIVDGGDNVKAGVPLATITSSVFEYIKENNIELLKSGDLKTMLPGKLNSLVKSPCDGRIIEIEAKNKQFTRQGDVLFDLARSDSQPYITAVFRYADANNLPIGTKVQLNFPGESGYMTGVIKDLEVDLESNLNTVVAAVEPDKTIPLSRIMKPVNVSVVSGGDIFSFLASARAVEGPWK